MDVRTGPPSPRSSVLRMALGLTTISLAVLQAACASAPAVGALPVHDAVRNHMSVQDAAARAAAETATKIAVERLMGGGAKKDAAPLPCAGRDGSISPRCAKANGVP